MTGVIDELRSRLQKELAPLSLEVLDDSAKHIGHAGAREGGHFTIIVVCTAFSGLPQLKRHRLVYAAIAPLMGRGVHALSIQAHSPDELH